MKSTGHMRASSSPSSGSGSSRSSCISAQRADEAISTSVAPASRWRNESLPGVSISKVWWACLSVETLWPRAFRHGIRRESNCVLPAPLHPAKPMIRVMLVGSSDHAVER
ncbi:Uncharacterised protein [Bordetella pertussis]|nr:Uncharacterised protein [Bordetella pertussis]